MSELSNYSIETDHTVVLSFKDGRRVRVPVGQLAHHLAPPDLEKVRASIRLRRDFIRRHMPKVALVMVAAGLIALLTVGGQAVAHLFMPPDAPTAPDHTGIVRSQVIETPAVTPAPSPAVKGDSTVAAAALRPSSPRKSSSKPSAKAVLSSKTYPTPLPDVTPDPTPLPTPIPTPTSSPTPTPTPTPTPSPTPTVSPEPPATNSSASDANGKVAGWCDVSKDPECQTP
jgi:hypothetical protein